MMMTIGLVLTLVVVMDDVDTVVVVVVVAAAVAVRDVGIVVEVVVAVEEEEQVKVEATPHRSPTTGVTGVCLGLEEMLTVAAEKTDRTRFGRRRSRRERPCPRCRAGSERRGRQE